MQLTGIEWTDLSCNPLKFRRKSDGAVVWACVKSSPGCANCYAEKIALRWNRGKLYNARNMEELTPFLDEKELHKMLTQQVIKGQQVSGSRCFVGDMTDIFGPWVPFELLDRLFAAFALRFDVTWQVLTKWPERAAEYLSTGNTHLRITRQFVNFKNYDRPVGPWPLPNVQLGTSVENQEQADNRIPHLLRCPAAVRFLSCEPLLGPVKLCCCDHEQCDAIMHLDPCPLRHNFAARGIDWVIVGGESGPKARPMHPDWAGLIRDQCVSAGVPFFFKQWGEWIPFYNIPPLGTRGIHPAWKFIEGVPGCPKRGECRMYRVGKKSAGRELDGREWNEFPQVETAEAR